MIRQIKKLLCRLGYHAIPSGMDRPNLYVACGVCGKLVRGKKAFKKYRKELEIV